MGKILIVEDNSDIRKLMYIFFKDAGFVVLAAVDGEEGLHMAKAEKPDVIITDIDMPKMDGIAMIKQLRIEPETASIPVVICTANASVTPEEVVKAGADSACYKPIDFRALIDMIRAMIAPDDNHAY
jgi:DNA-binding response OmpR family regulator